MSERISIDDTHFLKGLAISGVLAIHTIAQLTPKTFFAPANLPWIIGLDQLSRLSVPLFIALSGYGFAIKYQQKPLHFNSFFVSRVLKLLPLYIAWSIFFWTVLPLIPAWGAGAPASYIDHILYGGADYQMYFVPMILQLYLLFMALWFFIKRNVNLALFLAVVIQFLLYTHFTLLIKQNPTDWMLLSKTNQYLNALSWIGYFLLGIWLAFPPHFKKLSKLPFWSGLGAFVATLAVAFWSAQSAIQQHSDALLALRFTRWAIMAYACVGISFSIIFVNYLKRAALFMQPAVQWLGKHSYLIFLSHTIFLRIFFSAYRSDISAPVAVGLLALSFAMCLGSVKLQELLEK